MKRGLRRCVDCASWVIRDGEVEVYQGTQIIHTRLSCRPFRPAIVLGRFLR